MRADKGRCYDLSVDDASCFFANGVLVHNCKSPYTQNSLLLISAAMQRVNTLLLSATAAEDCTEMRAIGYALGLHSLNHSTVTKRSWVRWMEFHGCTQDEWGGWRSGPRAKLELVHKELYRDRGVRLTEQDMPEAFRENHIMEEKIDFGAATAIRKYYREAGLTPKILESLIVDGVAGPVGLDENILTRILRARQLAEASKLPEIVEMAVDLIDEGRSVVVFLNFRETAEVCKQMLEGQSGEKCSIIIGGQSEAERQANLLDFRDDRARSIVCTSAAGGTGVDGLQDTHGVFPRASLISPSFSAQEFKQVLGRISRAYAKSGVIQKVLIANNTVEEHVLRAIHRKLANMQTLHGQ